MTSSAIRQGANFLDTMALAAGSTPHSEGAAPAVRRGMMAGMKLFFMGALATGAVFLAAGCGGSTIIVTELDGGAHAVPMIDAATVDAAVRSCGVPSDCASSEFCDRKGACGTGAARGTCAPRPHGCTSLYSPTCGCDGNIYGNPCDANAHGQDLSSRGECPAPKGWFSCGDRYCTAPVSYCQITGNDAPTPGQPAASYACTPLPPSCTGKSDCSCFPVGTPCLSANQCKAVGTAPDVGFQIVCPGG